MSITDELREYIGQSKGKFTDAILAIADRIDEQHRRALERVAAMVDEPSKLDELDRAVAILEQHDIGNAIRISELRERVEALEKRCGKIAMFSYGENDKRIKDHERRVSAIERKLNHRG